MPLTALFVLFDFVIHNPTHNETESGMAYLDRAVGHFLLLDSASNGELPGAIVSGFAEIARRHVAKARGVAPTVPETPVGLHDSDMQREHHGLGNSFISVRAVTNSGQKSRCEGKIHINYEVYADAYQGHPTGLPSHFEAQQDQADADMQSLPYHDNLYYPALDSIQRSSGTRKMQLKSLFGWVFPDWPADELALPQQT